MVQESAAPVLVPGLGRRLGDTLRAAVASSDWAQASHLARLGDGKTRDLAREYALMVRGLGFTLDVLLGLLPAPAGDVAATAGLLALLGRLHQALADAPGRGAEDRLEAPAPDAPASDWVQACRHALPGAQAKCSADQHRRAAAVLDALDAHDAASALALLDAKDAAYLALHDPMVRFMADCFAWMLTHQGPHQLLQFHLATAEAQRAGFEKWEQMPPAEFAAATALLLQQHMGQVQVLEDAQRFTIVQSPCGSGGRLLLDGAAAAGPSPVLPWVDGSGPLTFGEPRAPVYCSHCAVWNGTATLRWFGRAQWVFENPARPDGGCTLHIYKQREDAPTAYTRRVAHAPLEPSP